MTSIAEAAATAFPASRVTTKDVTWLREVRGCPVEVRAGPVSDAAGRGEAERDDDHECACHARTDLVLQPAAPIEYVFDFGGSGFLPRARGVRTRGSVRARAGGTFCGPGPGPGATIVHCVLVRCAGRIDPSGRPSSTATCGSPRCPSCAGGVGQSGPRRPGVPPSAAPASRRPRRRPRPGSRASATATRHPWSKAPQWSPASG